MVSIEAIKKLRLKLAYAVEHGITPTLEQHEMKTVLSELKNVENYFSEPPKVAAVDSTKKAKA